MKAEGDEIRMTGKVVPGRMIATTLYIRDENGHEIGLSPTHLGLKWEAGDTVDIVIRRTPKVPA